MTTIIWSLARSLTNTSNLCGRWPWKTMNYVRRLKTTSPKASIAKASSTQKRRAVFHVSCVTSTRICPGYSKLIRGQIIKAGFSSSCVSSTQQRDGKGNWKMQKTIVRRGVCNVSQQLHKTKLCKPWFRDSVDAQYYQWR